MSSARLNMFFPVIRSIYMCVYIYMYTHTYKIIYNCFQDTLVITS